MDGTGASALSSLVALCLTTTLGISLPPLAVYDLLRVLDSIAVINTMTRSNLEKTGLTSLYSSQPFRKELEIGIQAGTEAETVGEHCLLAYFPGFFSFLIQIGS